MANSRSRRWRSAISSLKQGITTLTPILAVLEDLGMFCVSEANGLQTASLLISRFVFPLLKEHGNQVNDTFCALSVAERVGLFPGRIHPICAQVSFFKQGQQVFAAAADQASQSSLETFRSLGVVPQYQKERFTEDGDLFLNASRIGDSQPTPGKEIEKVGILQRSGENDPRIIGQTSLDGGPDNRIWMHRKKQDNVVVFFDKLAKRTKIIL